MSTVKKKVIIVSTIFSIDILGLIIFGGVLSWI
jgi:hypothetical protein